MDIFGPEGDFPLYTDDIKKVICLCFVPRSASNFLAGAMRETGLLGYPLEYSLYPNYFPMEMRLGVSYPQCVYQRRTSPNGVFAFKWNYHMPMMPITPTHYVFVDRRDRWGQARSLAVVRRTDDWLTVGNRQCTPTMGEITAAMGDLETVRVDTMQALRGKRVLEVEFDEVIHQTEEVVEGILEFCGVKHNNSGGRGV